jgi:trans-aconitate methyltransferase
METTSKPRGFLTPYLQRRRIAAARPYIAGSVLDVGCHDGPLCELVPADRYLGVDIDEQILMEARRNYPEHRFVAADEVDAGIEFDTVVSLAVVEHVPDPESWLGRWCAHLAPEGRVVLTTPHARWEPLHGVAARVRMTSVQAHDEHESVLDRASLEALLAAVGLKLTRYQRFLAGMNQLVVAER